MSYIQSFKSWLKETLKRESVKQLGFIYSSRMITSVLRFVASIIVARTLGPANLGVLTIATVVMGIAGRVVELGLTTTMVRKVAFYVSQDDDESAVGVFKRVYIFRVLISALLLGAFFFASREVAVNFFHNEKLTVPLQLAALGAFIYNIWYHSEGLLRALEKFKEIAIINVVSQVIRTGLIALFAYLSLLNVEKTLMFNISQIVIGFAIASLIIPRKFFLKKTERRYPLKNVLTYSGWMYLFSLLFMLFDRLDVLMLGYFRQAVEVGVYSVAFTLIKPFELIPETFNTVFLPKVSKFTSKSQIYGYFKDTLKVTGLIAVVGVALIFLAGPLITTFYGDRYIDSIKLFQILVGAFVLLTMINPLNLVGHSLNKPQLFALMAGINLALNFLGNLIFIPRYGALGAAVVTLISRVLGGVAGLVILKYFIDRWEGIKRESR